MFGTSCQSSHTCQHRGWQRRLQAPWPLLSEVCPVWRWLPSHTPDDIRDVARIMMTLLYLSNLDHLDHKEEGERERYDDHYHWDDCQQHRTHSRPLLTNWKMGSLLVNYVTVTRLTKRFLTSLLGRLLHFELFKVFNFRSSLSGKGSIKGVNNIYT